MLAKIIRLEGNKNETLGVLVMDGEIIGYTLELPYVDNKRNISCIPAGTYLCKRVNSPTFGNTFEVTGVEGRSNILFHVGNTHKDIRGCILLGSEVGVLGNDRAVLASRKTCDKFLNKTDDIDSFHLVIHYAI